jgi:phospholipase D1/2
LSQILQVGTNCWRRENASRIAFLIDAAAYYRALRDALLRAREQVLILGWDVDGRLRLGRDDTTDRAPEHLRELLNFIVEEQAPLHVHVLLWDFAILYALEREPLPSVNLKLRTSDRVHVSLDSSAPLGASRHEKIVVIDDRIAFCGGIDITENRWDTPEHALHEPRRVTSSGKAYDPFHDVQMAVDGEAAAALGEHCRNRIRAATGERLDAPTGNGDPWPDSMRCDAEKVSVAIARTFRDEGAEPIAEVERLYLDAIESAQDYVYIENQYFTTRAMADAIAERLQSDQGPEFVVVMPHRCTGWLEQQTMGVLRDRLLDELEEADVHGRLGLFTPVLDGDDEHRLTVHAKVMIVDDRFVRIGSSNLTRRSFAMDSECDLAIEADSVDEPVARSIRRLCNRLLAEHLGSDEDEVDRTRTETGSLLAAIEALGAGPRSLEPLRTSGEAPTATASIAATIGDPGDPIEAEAVMEDFRDQVVDGFGRFSGVFGLLGIAAFALALAMAWRYTPLAEYVQVDAVLDWIDGLRSSRAAPVGLLVVYLALGLAAFPITVVNVATAIAFGPWAGFLYALSGSLASAVLTFAVGRRFGSRVIHRISSGLVYRASRAIGKRGFLAVLSCRLVPVAPFTVINVVAGAMPIRIRDYLLGTLVGMAPGIAVLAAFGDRILKVVDDPNPMNAILLAAVVAVWLGLGWGFSRLLGASVENR